MCARGLAWSTPKGVLEVWPGLLRRACSRSGLVCSAGRGSITAWFTATRHMCSGTAHTCSGTAHMCSGTAHMCSGTAHTCSGTAHMCSGIAHMCSGTAHMCSGTAHMCSATAHTCLGSAHMCSGLLTLAQVCSYQYLTSDFSINFGWFPDWFNNLHSNNTHVTEPFSLLGGFFHAVLTCFTRLDGSLDMTLFQTMKHILP